MPRAAPTRTCSRTPQTWPPLSGASDWRVASPPAEAADDEGNGKKKSRLNLEKFDTAIKQCLDVQAEIAELLRLKAELEAPEGPPAEPAAPSKAKTKSKAKGAAKAKGDGDAASSAARRSAATCASCSPALRPC